MDRMNATVICLLAWIILSATGAYFIRDELSPLALHNTPTYPPPEYGMSHGWNASSGVFALTNNCAATTLQPGSTCTISMVFAPADTKPKPDAGNKK